MVVSHIYNGRYFCFKPLECCFFNFGGRVVHELGLMQDMFEMLRVSAAVQGIKRITKVRLVVGKFTAVFPDALEFAFSVLSHEPLLEKAVLEIEERETVGQCKCCEKIFTVVDYRFVCPDCGQFCIELISGRELYIDFYEGE